MPTEAPTAPRNVRGYALWISLGVVLLMCGWQATHDDDEAESVARPLTHSAIGAKPARPSDSVPQERRVAAVLKQSLAASAARAAFPALSDAGRKAWASAAPPSPAVVPSSASVAADGTQPAFPFQWIGVLTLPGASNDKAGDRVAIIAGPHSTWMAKQGDMVDEEWKILSFSAEQLQVVHLPSSSRQTVTMSKQ